MTADHVQQIAASIDPARVVDLTVQLCRVPSPLGGEGPQAEQIAAILDQPGIDVYVQEVVAGRPNVIATVPGGDGAPLVLNAHIDAAVAPGWTRDPYDPWVADGRVHGGGITDMKGTMASMIAALEAAARGPRLPGDLILHAVMSHNPIGLGSKFALAAEGPRAGYAICGQGSSMEIHAENGGAIKFEVALTGRAAHVSGMEQGIDALAAANGAYAAVRDLAFTHVPDDRLPHLPRFLVGEFHAGATAGGPALLPGSSVADGASFRGDVRTVRGMDRRTVRADLERVVAGAVPPEVRSRVRILSETRPFVGARSGPLVEALQEAHRVVRGHEPRFATGLPDEALVYDAPDYVAAGLTAIVYGPGPWRYAPDDWVAIDELVDAARIYLAVRHLLA